LTVVLVTHDIATVSALATKVAVLADGRILALETLDQIMRSENPIIRNFFQSDGTIARKGP
jgi:phospholipid/cholesterol/gamma-HCH transport system ATP-binding protein